MIVHPYINSGEIDRQAIDAANQRMMYYGTMGLLDPRTYTLDVYAIRKLERQPWKSTLRMSAAAAGYGAATMMAAAYLGYDPMEVTPGYGHDVEQIDPFAIDLRSLHM